MLKSCRSRSAPQPASCCLLLVSAAVKVLLERVLVLKVVQIYQGTCCGPMEDNMVPFPAMQDSALTVLSPESDLGFGVSPLTLCTSEEPTETHICAEICFECCYRLLLNDVFHLFVFLILLFHILVVQDPVLQKREMGSFFFFFFTRHFQLLTKLL